MTGPTSPEPATGRGVGVVLVGPDGNVVHVDPGGQALLGQEADVLVGAPWQDLVPQDDGWGDRCVELSTTQHGGLTVVSLVERTAEVDARAVGTRFEARMRTVFELSPVPTAVTRLDGRIALVNDALLQAIGWPREQVEGKTIHDIRLWPDLSQRDALLERLQRDGRVYDYEGSLRRRDGSVFPAICSMGLVELDGEPSLLGLFYDITDRVQAEAALSTSRAQLRAFLDNLPSPVSLVDLEGNVVLTNGAGAALHGRSPEELVGRSRGDLFPPQAAAEEAAKDRQVVDTRARRSEEATVHDPDGSVRWVLTQRFPVVEGDEVTAVGVIATDITDRKRLEQHAQLAEQRVRLMLESIVDGVIGVDASARCTFLNGSAEALLGYRTQDVVGREIHPLMHHSHEDGSPYPYLECPTYLTLTTGAVSRSEDEVLWRADGTPVPVRMTSSPVLLDGRITGAVITFHDMITRRQLEGRLIESSREALAANRTKSEFLATISHELRTPMNGVIGMAGLLLDTDLDAEQQEYAGTVRRSALSLLALLNDLLDLSKVEAGRMELEQSAFDPVQVLEEAAELLAVDARVKGLAVVVHASAALPSRVVGDAGRLRQVLVNLVGNAVKFTDAGEVVLRAVPAGGCDGLLLSVSDTGPGIGAELVPGIFDAFRQADVSTTRRFGGTGLGLTISQQLVELMGGRLEVHSVEGSGSTFSFTLPLPGAPGEAPEAGPLAGAVVGLRLSSPSLRAAVTEQLAAWGARAGDGGDVLLVEHRAEGVVSLQVQRAGRALLDGLPLVLPVRRAQLQDALGYALLGTPTPSTGIGVREPVRRLALRALVADDNPVNQRLLALLLEKAGCRVDAVADGEEAVAAFRAGMYDIVLLDCEMPRMDGYTAAAEMRRAHGPGQHVPIVAVTASAAANDVERALGAGMDAHIAKPIDRDRLLEVVRDLTAGRGPEAAPESAREPVSGVLEAGAVAQLRDLDDDGAALRSLVDLYCRDALPRVDELERAVRTGDAHAARTVAHRSKGAASAFGAHEIILLAEELEEAARCGQVPSPDQVEELRSRTRAVVEALLRLRPPDVS